MGSRTERRFGRYEVVSEIGRGAMGAVYKARDPKINRFVAIKAISAISQSPEEEQDYRQRFFHEAEAAGRLVHPGIVTVFDVGEEAESRTPYIVMEYVGGQSLSGLLSSETNKLPLEMALRLTQEIADALDCAHAQGVVHRDIKPANILLSGDGHAKIADFGIAKLNLSNVTLPGYALGTPAYMSPEQVDGRPVDGRSDLFSLGVILYNMVTGHRPFQGNSAVTVCYKVANWDPLPATSFDLDLPPEMDALIGRAIAKDPAHRYQRGAEFAREARALRQRMSGMVPSSSLAAPLNRQASPVNSTQNQPVPSRAAARPAATRPGMAPGTLALFAAALVVLAGFGIVLFGVPFHKRSGSANPVAQTLPSVAPRKSAQWPAPPVPEPEVALAPAEISKSVPPHVQARAARLTKASVKPSPALAQAEAPPPPQAPAVLPVKLKIEVQHHFAAGKVSLWVDDKLAYSADLRGATKRRLAVFHDVAGSDSAEVSVPAGQHTLRVNGSASPDFDESKTITAQFDTGNEKVLRVNFEKNNREMHLDLR